VQGDRDVYNIAVLVPAMASLGHALISKSLLISGFGVPLNLTQVRWPEIAISS
jgi:hypothetical protein